jgi:hypothetical protein
LRSSETGSSSRPSLLNERPVWDAASSSGNGADGREADAIGPKPERPLSGAKRLEAALGTLRSTRRSSPSPKEQLLCCRALWHGTAGGGSERPNRGPARDPLACFDLRTSWASAFAPQPPGADALRVCYKSRSSVGLRGRKGEKSRAAGVRFLTNVRFGAEHQAAGTTRMDAKRTQGW